MRTGITSPKIRKKTRKRLAREKLEAENIPMADAEVTMIPQTYVTLDSEEDKTNIQRILDWLDDDDDVQEVYHNWNEED